MLRCEDIFSGVQRRLAHGRTGRTERQGAKAVGAQGSKDALMNIPNLGTLATKAGLSLTEMELGESRGAGHICSFPSPFSGYHRDSASASPASQVAR